MDERRQIDRIPLENEVELKVLTVPDGTRPARQKLVCRTTDISPGGTRITLTGQGRMGAADGTEGILAHLREGATARLCITFHRPHKRFKLEGVVRWVKREPGSPIFVAGVEFDAGQSRQLEAWRHYIAGNLPPR